MPTETRTGRAYRFSSGNRTYGTTDMTSNPKIDFTTTNTSSDIIKKVTLTIYFTTSNFSVFDNYNLKIYLFEDGADMTSAELADNSNAFAYSDNISVSSMKWPNNDHSEVGYIEDIVLDISSYNIPVSSSITAKVTVTSSISEGIGYVYGASTMANLNTMIVEYGNSSHTISYHNGTEWVQCEVYYHDGTNWVLVDPYYHNGSEWVLCDSGG